MLPRPLWALIGMAPGLLACGDATERRVYINSGTLCLRPEAGTLHAEVKLLECRSSACNRQVAGACTMHRESQQISVSSRLVLEPNGAAICATDCGSWIVRCELPEPTSGAYAVDFGRMSAHLSLPLALDTELVGDGTTRGCSPIEPP